MQRDFSYDALPDIIENLQSELQQLKHKINSRPEHGKILNGIELCKELGISEGTLIRWRKAGKIPFMNINGGLRYDLNKVIEAVSVKASSPKK